MITPTRHKRQMMTTNSNSQSAIKELEFRVWFKEQFSIDYLEAVKLLNDRKAESNRQWNQLLTRLQLNS